MLMQFPRTRKPAKIYGCLISLQCLDTTSHLVNIRIRVVVKTEETLRLSWIRLEVFRVIEMESFMLK